MWPNAVRVTVGTSDDMAKFKVAFKDVMDNSGMAGTAPKPSAAGYGPIKGSTFLS